MKLSYGLVVDKTYDPEVYVIMQSATPYLPTLTSLSSIRKPAAFRENAVSVIALVSMLVAD